MIIRKAGAKIKATETKRVLNDDSDLLLPLRYLARARAVAAFANYDGCRLKLPISYHDLAPWTSFPTTSTAIRAKITNT